jgi:hypothetical protein
MADLLGAVVGELGLRVAGAALRRLRAGRRHGRRGPLHRGLVLGGVDLEEELPARDGVALLHREPHDAPRDVRRDVHLGPRLHLPARGHRGHERARRHGLDAHVDRLLVVLRRGHGAGPDDDGDEGAEGGQLAFLAHGLVSQRIGRPTALSSAATALWYSKIELMRSFSARS